MKWQNKDEWQLAECKPMMEEVFDGSWRAAGASRVMFSATTTATSHMLDGEAADSRRNKSHAQSDKILCRAHTWTEWIRIRPEIEYAARAIKRMCVCVNVSSALGKQRMDILT